MGPRWNRLGCYFVFGFDRPVNGFDSVLSVLIPNAVCVLSLPISDSIPRRHVDADHPQRDACQFVALRVVDDPEQLKLAGYSKIV